MLRATKPEEIQKRLKLFLYGPAGVGKSSAAIQFPRSYVIDCERGCDNYAKLINKSGSSLFQTTDINEVVQEVRSLLNEKHDYRTLVIDPITPVWNDLLDKSEAAVGSAHGRHYGAANKQMKRLANLIMALDMNVVMTAHAKPVYDGKMNRLGDTFEGAKMLDYWFDLVIELTKDRKKRMAKVVKTRIESFPDEDVFEWSYAAIKERYAVDVLEKEASTRPLATADQVRDIKDALSLVRLPPGTVDRWFAKAGVELWEDMAADAAGKCLEYIKARRPTPAERINGKSGERHVEPVNA